MTAADHEPITEQPAPEVVLEVERKYRVHGLFRMPRLEPFAIEEPVIHQLSATYVDTEDLRLARWGVTLRRREGGSDAGWHLACRCRTPTDPARRSDCLWMRAPTCPTNWPAW